MADAYARMSGDGRRGLGASGLRPDQRADRDRRGGEEPHAAARAGGGGDRAAVELLRRPGGARPFGGCGAGAPSTIPPVPTLPPCGRSIRPGPTGARSCSTCHSPCRPRKCPRTMSSPRSHPPSASLRERSSASRRCWRPRRRRCSSPAAVRAVPVAEQPPGTPARCWRRARRGPRASDRLRLAARGGSLDRGVGPRRRAGLRPDMWTTRERALVGPGATVVQVATGRRGVEVDLHHGGSGPISGRGASSTCSARSPSRRRGRRLDQLGGERRGEPAGDVERPRVAREQALGDRARSPAARRVCSASSSSSRRAAARARGRRRTPARSAAASSAGERSITRLGDAGGPAPDGRAGTRHRRAPSAACTSSGRLSTTVRRCSTARPVRAAHGVRGGRPAATCDPLGDRADGRAERRPGR